MMVIKIRMIFLALLFFLTAGAASAAAEPKEQDLVFSAQNAYEHARYLSQKIGPRPAGSKGEEKAAQYLYYFLEKSGWKVKEQPFSKIVVQNDPLNPENRIQVINSRNIIAELSGEKPDTVILGAHYDSADLSAPGALDNASGVGVLLELARILGNKPHKETYQIVFFGAEEYGLVGSEYFVSQADLSAVRWMLNLDMVGTPLEIDVAGKTSTPPELIEEVVKVVQQTGIPYHLSRDFIVMTREGKQGGNSDFSPFLDEGIPAVGLGIAGRLEGFYHRPEDRMDKVSLENMERIGELILQMLQDVNVSTLGPRTWDTSYLPFQVRSHVFIFPGLGVRFFFIGVLFFTGYLLIRLFRKKSPTEPREAKAWLRYVFSAVLVAVLSFSAVLISGSAELLWQKLKGNETLWYAYSGTFLGGRLLIGGCLLLLALRFLPKIHMPVSHSASFYWLGATGILLFVSLLLGLYRLDLAFPFVFWLLCLDILYIWPIFVLPFIAPYFIYRTHWELLNSQQWLSFYETLHRYPLIFTLVYTGLTVPLVFSGIYALLKNRKLVQKGLPLLQWPAVILFIVAVLGLGMIPSYTRAFPQVVTVQKEWNGNKTAQYHIFSPDILPKTVTNDLQQKTVKSVVLPAPAVDPPMHLEGTVQDQGGRSFLVSLAMKYERDPYRVQIKFQSPKPFRITQIDDFLPVAKLPRKVKLEGKERAGQYELILERTPTHRPVLQWSMEGEGKIHVTAEVSFPELSPPFLLQEPKLSVNYLETYKSELEF